METPRRIGGTNPPPPLFPEVCRSPSEGKKLNRNKCRLCYSAQAPSEVNVALQDVHFFYLLTIRFYFQAQPSLTTWYASKAADRRSVSGGLVMCGGACVSWFSRTQKCVKLPTTEAEYVALADVKKVGIFSRSIMLLRHTRRIQVTSVLVQSESANERRGTP